MARTRRSRRGLLAAGQRLGVLALVAWLFAGCGFSNLAFTKDNRLHFVTPKARALVHLPVTIRWEITGFRVVAPGTISTVSVSAGSSTGETGYFAVFVDTSPIKPGDSIDMVADRSCRRTPGCVTAGYLANRGVYTTWQDQVTIRQVSVDSYQTTQTHEATVVLLDPSGRRIGESAWYIDFRMKKLS